MELSCKKRYYLLYQKQIYYCIIYIQLLVLLSSMGNKYTKDQVDLVSSHPRFSKAQVLTVKDDRSIQTVIPCDDSGYNDWKKLLSKNSKILNKSNHLLLPKKHAFKSEGMCAHSGNATITYDYFPYLLSEEIANRHAKQQRFRESDLWYLLYSLLGAKNDLFDLSQRVGDIRPENVFINYDGEVRVGSIYSYPNEVSNYKKAVNLEPSLLAPEDMNKLSLGAIDNDENENSEIFSIGMTVIAAGILENPSPIYNFKNFTFNHGQADDLISKWRNSKCYSEIFRAVILNLVQYNPNDRMSSLELWPWVSKYEANIKSKEKFLINSVPAKIEREVGNLRQATNSSNTSNQHQTYEQARNSQEEKV